MDELKNLLGEELYNQVMEKLGDTPFTLGEGKIPLDRFNEVNNKKKELEETLKTVQEQLQGLQSERDTLNTKVSDLQGELKTSNINHRVEAMLQAARAKNPKTVRAVLDLSNIDDTEECYSAIQAQIDSLKTSDSYLFEGNVVTGNEPSTSNLGSGGITKEDFQKMSYKERVALYENNRELYDTLK